MKRILLPSLLAAAIFAAFLVTLGFLWWKAIEPEVVYATESPFRTDIVSKTVATGAVVPRNEVEIKSRVSGVVSQLAVEPGNGIRRGDLIAAIEIIPDLVTLNTAQTQVESARISRDEAKRELEQGEALFAARAISSADLERRRTAFSLRDESFQSSRANLQLVRDGASRRVGNVSTRVTSTVDGMVLTRDVKLGQSVIESNTFNAGTTIAVVADMSDLIFEGSVDESEVGKISEGLPLDITVGALRDRTFAGTLEYIAPKGELKDGAVQFQIRAAIELPDDVFIRAGSSANADIVLERRENALAVREALLLFEEDAIFVEVETSDQVFEKRKVEVGLSDGIQIEVKAGVTEADKLKAGTL